MFKETWSKAAVAERGEESEQSTDSLAPHPTFQPPCIHRSYLQWYVSDTAYLAHKSHPPSLGLPYGLRQSPTLGSEEGVVSYERGTPVCQVVASFL